MAFPKVFLKSRCEERILKGHLWVFSNEIGSYEAGVLSGEIVDLYSFQKKFIGRGFCNRDSLISVRLLTRRDEPIDEDFFSKRIEKAMRYRDWIYPGETCYRLVFGESDFLPGLVIDRFGGTLVFQSFCLGIDRILEQIYRAVQKNWNMDCLVQKNDNGLRTLEHLPLEVKIIAGQNPETWITQKLGDRSLNFEVHILEGQKTGFYFDQRENRERLSEYASGKSVLDCFSYSGSFAVYAAASGAQEVTAIESSLDACRLLQSNFAKNGGKVVLYSGDVLEHLRQFQKEKRKFDIILLDPPALAKSKKHLFSALRKYRELNRLAISLLKDGGILFSSSCSHHVDRFQFLEIVNEAARLEDKMIRLLEMRGQSRDHPILVSMPETDYLKCGIFRASYV